MATRPLRLRAPVPDVGFLAFRKSLPIRRKSVSKGPFLVRNGAWKREFHPSQRTLQR